MTNQSGADLFRLDGRRAFVSGAAGHLGEAISRGLGEAGAHVILNGRDANKLEVLASALAMEGISAETAAFDIMDTDAVKKTMGAMERLDIIVNLAYTGRAGALDTATGDDFDLAFKSSVTASFEITRAALPALEKAVEIVGHASVINISTMYAQVSPDPALYGASGLNSPPFYGPAKAGVTQLTRYLAGHLGARGIRVNSISPGPFPTPDIQKDKPDFIERLAAKNPLGRIGTPVEMKGAVIFLASDASTYVTGINMPVDGGWTAW